MSAHLPPTTADARIGSVGVRQADMARLERKLRPGIKAYMSPAHTNQPFEQIKKNQKKEDERRRTQVMPGTSRKNRLFQCFAI